MKKKEIKEALSREDISIQGNVATWNISAEGDIQGTYRGTFKFKCFLSPTEVLAAGRLYRELLGPNASLAFTLEDNLAYFLAQLKYRVISGPPFWSSSVGINGITGDVPDIKILDTILNAAVASENKYRAQIEQKKVEAIEHAKKAAERILSDKEKKDPAEEELDED